MSNFCAYLNNPIQIPLSKVINAFNMDIISF